MCNSDKKIVISIQKKRNIPNRIQWFLYALNIVIGSVISILFVDLINKEVSKINSLTFIECLILFLGILILFFVTAVCFECIAFIFIAIFQIKDLIQKVNIKTLISLVLNINTLLISSLIFWIVFIA